MPVAILVTVGAAVVAWLAMALWQGRLLIRSTDAATQCAACDVPLHEVAPEPGQEPRSYQVRQCGSCQIVVTAVHGSRAAFAYCPSCRQLALELTPEPARSSGRGGIDEQCQICGYRGTLHLRVSPPAGAAPDNVIQFPGQRR